MRFRTLFIAIALTVLAAGVVAGLAAAGDPSVGKLKQQLRHARQVQKRARERARAAAADVAGARQLHAATSVVAEGITADVAMLLPPATMDQALAATLMADGVVTADELAVQKARGARTQKLARRWTAKVRRLQQRVRSQQQIAKWNQQGQWEPLIAIAAKKYGVSAAGLYRMMMLESGGQRTADTGPYHGLFQFMDREWGETWNEWRDHSIYDGWSQIQLTAKCIGRGMGPSIWPLTYRMAF